MNREEMKLKLLATIAKCDEGLEELIKQEKEEYLREFVEWMYEKCGSTIAINWKLQIKQFISEKGKQ